MKNRPGPSRVFDVAAIAAALAANDGNVKKASAELGCCDRTIYKYARENGMKLPYAGRIQWKAGGYAKLEAMFNRSPRPSIKEMAAELQTTEISIMTALSRAGLTRATHKRKAATRRPCIICSTPFLADGPYNRQCVPCYSETSEMAE